MADDVGSLVWGEQSGGRLTAQQVLAMVARSLPEIGILCRSQLRVRTGRRGTVGVNLKVMSIPDSPLGRAAAACAENQYRDEKLKRHAYRTIVYAHAIAALEDIPIDGYQDLLWSACLLHDIALERGATGRCFAVRSGRLAHDAARRAGVSQQVADVLGDAICRHPAPGIDRVEHPVAYLVNAGALVDVTGRLLERLDPNFVAAVIAAQPRDDPATNNTPAISFGDTLAALWRAESAEVPAGRANVARHLGFAVGARWAPY